MTLGTTPPKIKATGMRFLPALIILSAVGLLAQGSDESARIRSSETGKGQAGVIGEIPSGVLELEKAKGTLSAIDLEARTVTIKTKKSVEPMVLTFSQPEGREQIKASKKVEKRLGLTRISLEDLETGTPIQLRYYPVLGQILDLTIDAK